MPRFLLYASLLYSFCLFWEKGRKDFDEMYFLAHFLSSPTDIIFRQSLSPLLFLFFFF